MVDDEWWTAIWHKCRTLLVAGELLDVHKCALSTRMAIGKMHWVQLSKICGQQERLAFEKLHKRANGIGLAFKLVGNKKIPVRIPHRSGRKIYISGAMQKYVQDHSKD